MDYDLAFRLKNAGFPQKEPLSPTFMQSGTTTWLFHPKLEDMVKEIGQDKVIAAIINKELTELSAVSLAEFWLASKN